MFSFLFLIFSSSLIKEMTADIYRKEFAKKRISSRVWCLLGYKPYVKNLKIFETAIEQAKIITNGSIAYAKINCQAEPTLCQQLKINDYPTIIFKNRTQTLDFQEPPNPSRIVKIAMSLVNSSLVQEIDDFWLEDYREKPTAILFASGSKRGVPGWFAAISRVYQKSLRCGICHDESLLDEFGIKSIPTLAFYDGDRTILHEGKLKFRFVNETANSFLHKRPSRSPVGGDFHVNSELPEVCYDYSKTCIFTYEDFITPEMDEMKNKIKSQQFQFFVGKDNFPFKNIQNGECVIYSAKKDGIIVVSDPSKVPTQLDRVVDGTAKFKSLGDFQYGAEL